MSEMYVANPG